MHSHTDSASPAPVSVIIPVYDTGLWTLDAIDSCLSQSVPPLEVLLVDDGSQAPTADLLDRAAAAHPELVRVIRHPQNRGLAAARNTGIAAARGEALILLDSDDKLADEGLVADIGASLARDRWDMLRLRLEFFKQDPVSGVERRWADPGDQFIPADLSGVSAAQVPALFQTRANWQFAYRRAFLTENAITFDEELRRREDRPFLTHALLKAKRVDMWSRTGFLYRQRPDSIMHDPKLEDLELFSRGVEIGRDRIDAAGEAQGPARFILEIHYLTGLHGLSSPFLQAGEEDAVRAMLARFRSVVSRDLPAGHPGAGPEAAEAFGMWPALARQTVFPPSPTRELESGWLAALHAALLDGADQALELIWAAMAAPRPALAAGTVSAASAAAQARAEVYGETAPAPARPRRPGAEKPRLLLHIGLTKTGSTSLQNFFELNRARLLDRGAIYPEAGIFREEGTDRGSGHNMAVRELFRDGPRPVFDAMQEEIAQSGARLAIVSCENLSWNPDWRGPAGVEALARAFEGFEVHPLLVVRDEFDWFASMYKEAVAGGWLRWGESPAEFFRMQEALGGTDFAAILDGYAALFGAENCHAIDVKGEGALARRALACVDPALAADDGLIAPPRANIGTPDAIAPALRLLNRLPAEGAVERAFLRGVRERPAPEGDAAAARIEAVLDGLAARRAEAGRTPWSAEDRAARADRLRALWGSADVNLAADLVTDRVRWARRPAAPEAAPVEKIEPAPAEPIILTPIERMLDHDQGEEARRIRRFGAPRPYGFSVTVDPVAAMARISSEQPLGEIRLLWDALDGALPAEEGEWTALPEEATEAAVSIPLRRFAAHARLTIFARLGRRVWKREVCFAMDQGAPFALVIGGGGGESAAPRLAAARRLGGGRARGPAAIAG